MVNIVHYNSIEACERWGFTFNGDEFRLSATAG
jgi:hypothetical protein